MHNIQILYVIPQVGNGGAETIFNSFEYLEHKVGVRFTKVILGLDSVNPFSLIKGFLKLLRYIKQGERVIIISSLWKSHMICVLIHFFWRKIELIPFIHSAYYFHKLDELFTRYILLKSVGVLFDSEAARSARHELITHANYYVPSMFTHKTDRCRNYFRTGRDIRIVYVGRMTEEKGVMDSIKFCKSLLREPSIDSIQFHLYGKGNTEFLRECIYASKFTQGLDLKFMGELGRNDLYQVLSEYDLYLQLSHKEGLAMSVVEAMSLGLLCLVTPVGEIPNYCAHMKNGFLVQKDTDAAAILTYLEDARSVSRSAHETFKNHNTFSEDLTEWINKYINLCVE